MKAIVVKYFGPTHLKGSRLRVSAEGVPSMTVSYDHGAHEPKLDAAKEFCRKHGWHENIQEGTLPNGDAVFVFLGVRSAIVRNAEGLTIDEWLAAAGRTSTESQYDLRAAWRAGEDPTEYKNDD
jgi:hypothetical protein